MNFTKIVMAVALGMGLCFGVFFSAVSAEKNPFLWECVGCDPYIGGFEEAVDRNPYLSKGAKAGLKEKIKKSVVDAESFKKYVEGSDLKKEEKDRLLELAKSRSFIPWQIMLDRAPASLLEKIKQERKIEVTYELGEIKVGEEISSMVFGRGERKDRVIAKPRSGEPVKALVYTVEDEGVKFVTKLPLVCNNFAFSGYVISIRGGGPKKPESPPLLPVAAKAVSVEDDHTIRIRIWDSKSAKAGSEVAEEFKRMLAEPGYQSRDFGKKLRLAAAHGEIKPYTPCVEGFTIEFEEFAYAEARGKKFYLDGKPATIPNNFGPKENAYELKQVCNGEGALTISRKWLLAETVVKIHSPWRKPDLWYPPSGRLHTKRQMPGDRTWCGKKDASAAGEFYKLAMHCNASNFHFVK